MIPQLFYTIKWSGMLTFLRFLIKIYMVMNMEKIYKREDYLKKIRGFYNDDMIKVVSGVRRCGKSYFLKSIIQELQENGIKEKDIIYIELDSKQYKDIKTPKQLEKVIDSQIKDDDFKYLFIDEVQNVKNFETQINMIDGKIDYAQDIVNTPLSEYKTFEKEVDLSLARQELAFLSSNQDIVNKEKQKETKPKKKLSFDNF